MADIDNLQIQISADASKASRALDNLADKFNKLSNAMQGVSAQGLMNVSGAMKNFSSAAQTLSNIKTADFTRFCKNLNNVSNINYSGLSSVATSMNQIGQSMRNFSGLGSASKEISEFASNLAKLGGVKAERAVTLIPQLGSSLKDLMSTLSKTPIISRNVIDMTNALANLASQGQKIGTATNTIHKNINNVGKSARENTKHITSLAAAFGKFYANCFLIIRGVKGVWKAIQSSMNYTEVANYMNASIRQATSSIVEQMGGIGEASAQAYVERFRNSIETLQAQMTGFKMSEDGLTMANGTNLGLDITKLTNYQAQFMQMASSMGTTTEQAQKLSNALIQIGADLASVKNMDFDKVWGDMASGLVGMSRTLDKYGVNIRNVNLQQELQNLGLTANINKLNQNEKALLRTIVLLKSTNFAYADLSNTINQPANQLRVLQANFQKLGMILGTFFIPVVKTVMTWLNGLTVALQRVLITLGTSLGFKFDDLGKGVASSGDAISDVLDDMDSMSDALDDATASANKLKTVVNGIDELNINNPNSGNNGTSGVGLDADGLAILNTAFDESIKNYQTQWEKALGNVKVEFEGVAKKIQTSLDKIVNKVKPLFESIKNLIDPAKSFIGGFVEGIKPFASLTFDGLITLLNVIGSIPDGVMTFLGSSLASFLGVFATYKGVESTIRGISNGISLLGNSMLTFVAEHPYLALAAGLVALSTSLISYENAWIRANNLKWDNHDIEVYGMTMDELRQKYDELSISLENNMKAREKVIEDASGEINFIGMLRDKYLDLAEKQDKSAHEYAVMRHYAEELVAYVPELEGYYNTTTGMIELEKKAINDLVKARQEEIKFQALGEVYKEVLKDQYKHEVAYKEAVEQATKANEELNKVQKEIDEYQKQHGLNANLQDFQEAYTDAERAVTECSKAVETAHENYYKLVDEANHYSEMYNQSLETIAENQEQAANIGSNLTKTIFDTSEEETDKRLPTYKEFMDNRFKKVEDETILPAQKKTGIEACDEFYNWMISQSEERTSDLETAFESSIESIDVSNEATKLGNDIGNDIEDGIEQSVFKRFSTWWKKMTTWDGSDDNPPTTARVSTVPQYAVGGFPEDGLFMANHGEMVGGFSNGKTAVANNAQIVDGIEGGVERAVTRTLLPYLQSLVSSNDTIASKDMSIDIDGRELARSISARTTRNGFSFT